MDCEGFVTRIIENDLSQLRENSLVCVNHLLSRHLPLWQVLAIECIQVPSAPYHNRVSVGTI
jgi:hypothetical protein